MEQRKGYLSRWRGLGRIEKAFLLLAVLYALLYVARLAPVVRGLAGLGMSVTGLVILFKLARRGMRTAIWRLRNRLVIAYLFIAVVPLVLVLTLVMLGVWAIIGTMAVYLVNTELTHREDLLRRQAEIMARLPVQDTQLIDRFVTTTRNLFPNCELRITGAQGDVVYPTDSKLTHPPKEWKRANGLITKGSGAEERLYVWAHEVPQAGNSGREQPAFGRSGMGLPAPGPAGSAPPPDLGRRPRGLTPFGGSGSGRPGPPANNEVTILVPVTHERLAGLVPEIGDVSFTKFVGHLRTSHVPPPANFLDLALTGAYPLDVPAWESPGSKTGLLMTVDTRLSAVLGIVFGQRQTSEYGSMIFTAFIVVSVLFLVVELVSLVAGVSLSRTITGAVHEMYQGTQHVKEGDFSYRIPVKGNDQLAEMCTSFNTMTENLGRLIVVAKEKERLESELAIAREVQNQLFPKDVPGTKTLELKGVCRPARMVSGDYYDFISLSDQSLAFAIGDVAGKGISAALLMATIQSTMRTQLGAQNGHASHLSTAAMVANLNKQLYATTAPEKYATFYFALYDEPTNSLTYTNAGHLSPLLLRGNSIEMMDSTGTVVGAFPFARYDEKTVKLEHGDVLVAYTDGIVEPENAYGEMFGDERLHDLLLKFERADSSEMIARTMEAVAQWTGSSELQDDMTMVVARRI